MGSEKSIAIETSKTAVDLLGILLGFTISLFAIILSVDNEIINKAKLKSLDVKFYKEKFTVYDRLITNIAFVIFLFSLLLIYNFLFPVIFESILKTYLIFYVLDVAIIIFSIPKYSINIPYGVYPIFPPTKLLYGYLTVISP